MILQPQFIEGSKGKIYLLSRNPDNTTLKKLVIFVQPFAEEANKSRHMLSLIAHQLAKEGVGSVLFDYFGTGESFGEFQDATLSSFSADLSAVIEYCSRFSTQISLVCIRLGALVTFNNPSILKYVDKMILVNPVTSGRQLVNQFFRLRTAASLTSGEQKVNSNDIKNELCNTGYTEIAGYMLNKQLVDELDGASLDRFLEKQNEKLPPLYWIEINNSTPSKFTPVVEKNINEIKPLCCHLESLVITGDSFWSTQEISVVPALIDKVSQIVR